MITFVQCVRRRPELSIQEFREHWQDYAERARALAAATQAVGLFVNTTLAVEENLTVQLERGTSAPFDGVLKFCWPNAAGLEARLADPEVERLVDAFQRHQDIFIDRDQSSFFFASEEAVIGGARE
jgi:hypothetical protein